MNPRSEAIKTIRASHLEPVDAEAILNGLLEWLREYADKDWPRHREIDWVVQLLEVPTPS